jgi:outer membrane protein TolC
MEICMLSYLPLIVLSFMSSNALALTVDDYLGSVKKQNLNYLSSEKRVEGSRLLKREADLYFTPQFFFNAQKGYDAKLFNPPFLVYEQVKQQKVSAGISQEFSFGVETRLSYDLVKTQYRGISFNPGIDNPYWDAVPTLEINIPLWGNAFGRTAKARKETVLQQRTFDHRNAEAQIKRTLVDAEIAYWRLAAAQESVRIQKRALDASSNIYSYVVNKKSKNLGEEADVLQAKALSESYQLQLAQAEIDERAARRKYNLYLNVDASEPVSELLSLDYKGLLQETVPNERPGDRPDVQASKAQVALAIASSRLSLEQNKPTLNLYGGYSLFGRDGNQSTALSRAGTNDRESAYFGVRFQMPLNVSALADAREGAKQTQTAAELNNKYLVYSQDQEWIDLTSLFRDAQTSLRLAELMEKAQKAKLNNERVRLRQGRTTTYQVLLFEQDYLASELARIRAANQIIALKSQIQLYSSND